jgi:DNA-binding MarR family transcriptional regulator
MRQHLAMDQAAQELYECLQEFLRRMFSLAEAEATDLLVDLDVSLSQARTMFVLAHVAEAVPIHQVAGRLGLSQAAAGRTVDQLVKLGIVERHESADDRRVKLVSLSPRGFDIADQHIEQKRKAIRAVSERLPTADCARLTAALRPILAGDCLSTSTKERVHDDHH